MAGYGSKIFNWLHYCLVRFQQNMLVDICSLIRCFGGATIVLVILLIFTSCNSSNHNPVTLPGLFLTLSHVCSIKKDGNEKRLVHVTIDFLYC